MWAIVLPIKGNIPCVVVNEGPLSKSIVDCVRVDFALESQMMSAGSKQMSAQLAQYSQSVMRYEDADMQVVLVVGIRLVFLHECG